MKDIKEILCKAFGRDEDDILGDYETEHEPVETTEDGFQDDLVLRKTKNGEVVIGYLTHDDHPVDFWSDSDGMGKLSVFRSETERDEFLSTQKEKGLVAFIADNYRHGQEHWSVQNTANYPDRRWDVAPRGVYVPDAETVEHIRNTSKDEEEAKARIIKDANAVLDEYSKTINGEVYGVVTETWVFDAERNGFEMTDEDSVWGHIGWEHAVDSLREQMPVIEQDASLEP